MTDIQTSVSESDILKSVQILCGPQTKLKEFKIAPATSIVQGFSSNILRITANVEVSQDCSKSITFIVKKEADVLNKSLIDDNPNNDYFEREVLFFQHGRPLLHGENLAIVRCLSAQSGLIILEDLTPQGFHILAQHMSDMSTNVLKYPHLKMIMERLAQIHAASHSIDWLQILPYLKQDSFLETPSVAFPILFKKACKAYSEALDEFYPEVDKKYSEWLKSSKPLETLLQLVKPKSNELNVLAHGDFWVNNIMFKVDSNTNLPLDVRFIDYQLCRYVPPSRDIQNLLYTCGYKALREEYESSLLQTYVTSFNEFMGYEKLKLKDFIEEYESSRLFGVSVALVFRSMNLMSDLYPKEGEVMTDEIFNNMISGVQFENMLQRCHKDSYFTENVKELLLELISVLNKRGV